MSIHTNTGAETETAIETEGQELGIGDEITVEYDRLWQHPPDHWDDRPTVSGEVEHVQDTSLPKVVIHDETDGMIHYYPEDGTVYQIDGQSDLYRSVQIGENAEVRD